MDHKITIVEERHRQRAIDLIVDIPLFPLHEVIIKPVKITRMMAQNALYWAMNTHLEKHSETGNTKDDWHEYFKEKYLVRIYIKKPENHPLLVSNIEIISELMEKGLNKQAGKLWENLLKALSTTEADVEEFWEYLKCVEHEMISIGCVLPVKDDIYKKAMGMKK